MLYRKRIEYQPLIDTFDKELKSLARFNQFCCRDKSHKNILAFSGGKDSVCAYYLAVKSGIEFTPIYSRTSADPPELLYFIDEFNLWAERNNYPEVIKQKYNKFTDRQLGGSMAGKEKTMWSLIGNRAMPPTRRVPYCCGELKERTGEPGDIVFTGVRWEESKCRAEQKMVNFYNKKTMVRAIVDWTKDEVWSIILSNDIPYCILYDMGWDRIGCLGCPKAQTSNRIRELTLYPAYKELYIRSFDKMLEYRKNHDLDTKWSSGEEVLNWWLYQGTKNNVLENQCSMF